MTHQAQLVILLLLIPLFFAFEIVPNKKYLFNLSANATTRYTAKVSPFTRMHTTIEGDQKLKSLQLTVHDGLSFVLIKHYTTKKYSVLEPSFEDRTITFTLKSSESQTITFETFFKTINVTNVSKKDFSVEPGANYAYFKYPSCSLGLDLTLYSQELFEIINSTNRFPNQTEIQNNAAGYKIKVNFSGSKYHILGVRRSNYRNCTSSCNIEISAQCRDQYSIVGYV